MSEKPLDGYRVVDLTHVLAGPYCTYQLGLLGADVIKVESLRGDMVRNWGGTDDQLVHRLGTGFAAQNAGKRSLAVDLTRPEGAEIVRTLAERADIFVENYRPGALARYSLDYEPVRERNPGLIYLSISAFGQTGPHGHRPGFDDVVQATSGFMSINVRGDGPIRTGGPVLDYATGMHATSAVLAAALLRQRSGQGRHIDVAMQDVTMLLMNRHTSIAASTGVPPKPLGNREGLMLGRYPAKESYVMLAGYLPRHRRAICKAIGLDRFAELGGRELDDRADEIERAVERKLLERTAEEWDAIFSEAGVVAGGVRDLIGVLATGQPDSRDLLTEVESAAGPFQVTTSGYRMDGEVLAPTSGVPLLGQHTREVLDELGYGLAEIQTLVESSIVAATEA
jgi:crotonobetainyl-CoA:carnitine CoA-transferase CaiB-like acyl-CoA transferase